MIYLNYIYIFLMAFGITWVFTPVAIKIAHKIGAIDIPKDERRVHSTPIPRFGGIAIYLGTVAGILAFVPIDKRVVGLLTAGTIIFLLGIVDDLKCISARVKLGFQIICAAILFVFGVKITFIGIPFIHGYYYFPWIVSLLITILWIVGITNTINLIDGLDGLAAGIAFIASLSLAYTAYINYRPDVALVTLALAGGALGFLPFNFNPAKIFMGDGGSLFLGMMLAGLSVMGPMKGATAIATVVPLLALGLPIYDTLFAIFRRLINNRPIMEPDKGHLHHRILAKGMSQKRTVIILYSLSGILGISAVLLNKHMYIDSVFLMIFIVALVYVFSQHKEDSSGNDKKQ